MRAGGWYSNWNVNPHFGILHNDIPTEMCSMNPHSGESGVKILWCTFGAIHQAFFETNHSFGFCLFQQVFLYDRFLHFRYILQTRSGGKSESLKSLNIDILHLRVTLKIKTFKNRIFIFDLRMTSFISHSQVLFVAWNKSLWFARMHIALLFFPEMEKNLQFNLKLSSELNYNGGVWPWLAPPNQSRVKGEWGGEWGGAQCLRNDGYKHNFVSDPLSEYKRLQLG